MRKKFRIGIIGCGDMSRFMTIAGKVNREIRIVACADVDEKKAKRHARLFGIPEVYGDYKEMLDNLEMDAVYVAVPHYLHFPMINDAIDAGIHVFCEKPVATTLDDAIAICRISQEKGVKVGINYQYRYNAGCYALYRASQKGDLGELYYGRCNVPWHREKAYFEQGRWRSKKKEAGGGTLLTQASHTIDILLWALGGRPVSALGVVANKKFKDIEVEDLGMGIIEMENGAVAQICSSMVANPEQKVTIEIYGEICTGIYKGSDYLSKVIFKGRKVEKEKPPVRGIHALTRGLEAFRRWVVYDEPFLNSAEDSLPVLASIMAIYRSASSGKKEMVDTDFL